MAIISGVSLSIDIAKLKQDLEQSGVLKVLSITPTATGFQCEIINADNFDSLSPQETALAESIISTHQDQQKRKLQVKEQATEIYDATNKEFVDNKIDDIIGPNANAALDTLMELSTALNNDSNFATTIATQINQLETDITSLESSVQSLQQADQLLATNIQQGDQTVSTTLSTQLSTEQTTRENADINLQNQITSISSSLKPVATSGSYTDLTNKPSLFGGSYNDLSDKPTLFSGAYADLTGKPSLATVATSGSYTDLTNNPTIPTALTDLSDVTISTATKGQFVVHNGTEFVNSNTIEANTSTTKPIIIKAAASQTANLLEVQANNGAIIAGIDASGNLISPTITNIQQGIISFPGAIIAYGGSVAPSGWLMCDGQSYLITDYQNLYNVIGTTYNSNGDLGSLAVGYFKVPDLRRRVPTGKGSSDSLGAHDGNDSASRSLTHSHTVTVPGHYHDMSGVGSTLAVDIAHSHGTSAVTGSITLSNTNLAHTHSGTTNAMNSNASHGHTIYDPTHAHRQTVNANPGLGDGSGNQTGIRVDYDYDVPGGQYAIAYDSGNYTWASTTGISINSTNIDHTHAFATGGASATMDHTHTVSSISLTAAGQSLAATSKTPTGRIGKVTGGVDGNSDQSISSNTKNNNNYLIVNYIIKT